MMRANSTPHTATSAFDPVRTFIDAVSPTIVETVDIPSRGACFADVPPSYHTDPAAPIMRNLLPDSGKLWRHQSLALAGIDAGDNVLVTTGTGSGKSLTFQLPVIRELLEGDGTTLILYPQKALGSDQFDRWHAALNTVGLPPTLVGELHGGIPMVERNQLFPRARLLLATPDVVQAWLLRLQSADHVQQFLSRLRFIVIDEAHMFDSSFGSQSAYLLRRLRFAALQARRDRDTRVQLIATSATMGDPLTHIEALTGCSFLHIGESDNGAPSQALTLLHVEGPDRGQAAEHALAAMIGALKSKMGAEAFIVFADARQGVERISKLADDDRILPYRSGFEQHDRRAIEKALKSGEINGCVSTSALEVGIDIPRFRIGIALGVPPTRKSLRQRAGRVGRTNSGLFVVVAPRAAFTRLGTSFAEFATGAVEPGHLHLQNPIIQYQQACCLRAEIGEDANRIADALQAVEWPDGFAKALEWAAPGAMRPAVLDRIASLAGDCPHFEFPLRQIAEINFKLRLANDPDNAIGEIGIDKAIHEAYPGATYLHMRKAFRVVGWRRRSFERSILLKPLRGHATTKPLCQSFVSVSHDANDILDRHHLVSDRGALTECCLKVASTVHGYSIGTTRLLYADLVKSDRRMQSQSRHLESTGVFLQIKESWFAGSGRASAKTRKNVAQALRAILLSEQGILNSEVDYASNGISLHDGMSGRKLDDAIVLFDNIPGGLRLTQPLFDDFQRILDCLERAVGMAGEECLLDSLTITRLREWHDSLSSADGFQIAENVRRIFAPGSIVNAMAGTDWVMRKLLGHEFMTLDGRDKLMYRYEVDGGSAWVSADRLRPAGGDWSYLPDLEVGGVS